MKAKKQDELIKRYLEAETTLDEEKELISSADPNSEFGKWSKFVKQNQNEIPADLNDSLKVLIKERNKRKQRFMVQVTSIAASIALLVTIYTYTNNRGNNSYLEKEAKLNEAISMFSTEDSTPKAREVIYEDEMVIIYLAQK